MAPKKSSPSMDLAVDMLQADPNVEYASVRAAAENKGIPMFPIVYGRAKKALGLAKASPAPRQSTAVANRRTSERGRMNGYSPSTPKPAPARRAVPVARNGRKASVSDSFASLTSVIEEMKSIAAERDRYRSALERIASVLEAEL